MTIEARLKDAFFLDALKRARALDPKFFNPEFAQIGQFMRNEILEGFAQERDPYGNPWKPLARSTVSDKIKRGVNNGILKETGEFSKSFQYRILANGVRVFSNHVFDDGTDASIHQDGGIHPETGSAIPARPVVPDMDALPGHWQEFIDRTIGDGLDRLFK